jgi:hypothetical protein
VTAPPAPSLAFLFVLLSWMKEEEEEEDRRRRKEVGDLGGMRLDRRRSRRRKLVLHRLHHRVDGVN